MLDYIAGFYDAVFRIRDDGSELATVGIDDISINITKDAGLALNLPRAFGQIISLTR